MSRQLKQIVVLSVLLVIALGYAYLWYPRQETVDGNVFVPRNVTTEGTLAAGDDLLAGLTITFPPQQVREFVPPKRDIFRPLYVPPKPKPKPKPKSQPKLKPKPKHKSKPVVVEAPKPKPKPRQPLAKFALLGFLDNRGARTVFLQSLGKIYLVRQGETFFEDYYVDELTDELLRIKKPNDNRKIEIDLKVKK